MEREEAQETLTPRKGARKGDRTGGQRGWKKDRRLQCPGSQSKENQSRREWATERKGAGRLRRALSPGKRYPTLGLDKKFQWNSRTKSWARLERLGGEELETGLRGLQINNLP